MGLVVLTALLVSACTDDGLGDASSSAERVLGPYTTETVTADLSDHDCNIVLRDVARVSNGTGGYEVNVVDGQRHYVWVGHLDTSSS